MVITTKPSDSLPELLEMSFGALDHLISYAEVHVSQYPDKYSNIGSWMLRSDHDPQYPQYHRSQLFQERTNICSGFNGLS